MPVHLAHRDVSFVVISRAPLAKIQAFEQRMGWRFKWVSSNQTDFNYDFGVSFTPEETRTKTAFYNYVKSDAGPERQGLSAFYKDEHGAVFHTYSTYARGIDLLNSTYNCLDMAPKGRDEDGPEWPQPGSGITIGTGLSPTLRARGFGALPLAQVGAVA